MVKTIYGLTYSDWEEYSVIALFETEEEAEKFKSEERYYCKNVSGYGINDFEVYKSADEAFKNGIGTRKKEKKTNE